MSILEQAVLATDLLRLRDTLRDLHGEAWPPPHVSEAMRMLRAISKKSGRSVLSVAIEAAHQAQERGMAGTLILTAAAEILDPTPRRKA